MERDQRPTMLPDAAADTCLNEGAALRDAAAILARADEDEAAADAARARYRTRPLTTLPPDDSIGPLLVPGERVVAVRSSALLERRQPAPGAQPTAGAHPPAGLAGRLYVTSRRLLLVGRLTLSYELQAVEEAMLSGERLLLLLRDGQGLTLEAAQPRLLRVEIAAARAAARA
jgi:hypothetical protein